MWPSLLAFLIIAPPAVGGGAYYHPDDVARRSMALQRASEAMVPAFERVQGALQRYAEPLSDLDRDVTISGARAGEALQAHALQLRTDAARGRLAAQAFVDDLTEGFEAAFGAALQRALEAEAGGLEVRQCGARGVDALVGRNPCSGTDLNGRLAARMDQDPVLAREIQQLSQRPWPEFALAPSTQAAVPVTGDARYVRMDPLVDALLAQAVAEAQGRHRAAWDDPEAGLPDEEEGLEARQEAVERGEALRQRYDAELVGLGETFFPALEAALGRAAKKGLPADVGLCPNPTALGGCAGEDVTDVLLPALLADRRLLRDLGR